MTERKNSDQNTGTNISHNIITHIMQSISYISFDIILFLSFFFRMQYVIENNLLNDNCMLEVFKFFDLKELLIISQVSLQFERLAHKTFSRKYRHLQLNNHFSKITKGNLLALFKNFGHLIQSFETPTIFLPWNKKEIQKFIIMLLKKYCSGKNGKLESLKLNCFGSINRYLILMNDVFLNLKILHLEYVAVPFSALQLLNKLPKINELNLSYCIPILPISTTFQPTVNLNLKNLTLRCRNRFYLLDVVHVIHQLYPNIVELKFQIIGSVMGFTYESSNALRNIGLLKSLITLDIDIECESINSLISNLTLNKHQLKHLCVRYTTIFSNTIDCLSELNSLEELLITNTINKHPMDIYNLIEKLPNLRIISIIDIPITILELSAIIHIAENLVRAEFKMANNIMNKNILQNIIHTIERRKNKQPLWLILHVNGQNEINEYKNYIKSNNQSNKLLRIDLTYTGINLLAKL